MSQTSKRIIKKLKEGCKLINQINDVVKQSEIVDEFKQVRKKLNQQAIIESKEQYQNLIKKLTFISFDVENSLNNGVIPTVHLNDIETLAFLQVYLERRQKHLKKQLNEHHRSN